MPSNISKLVLVVGTAIIITVAGFFYLADQNDERPITASPESVVLRLDDLPDGWGENGTEWYGYDNVTGPYYSSSGGWTWGTDSLFYYSVDEVMRELSLSIVSWNSTKLANKFYGEESEAWKTGYGDSQFVDLELGDEGVRIADYEHWPGNTVYIFREGNIYVLLYFDQMGQGNNGVEPWMDEIVGILAERIHQYDQ